MILSVSHFNDRFSEKGAVLVMALLYLLVITLLVVSALSSGILQIKMNQHVYQEAQAFERAESVLLIGEKAISIDQIQGQGQVETDAYYQFHQVQTKECGLFYQVYATATVRGVKTSLQSIFIFPKAGENPCVDMLSGPHRVLWQRLQ